MSGRGHRKLRLCSRKNYERKKRKKLSTPLSACSFLTVSIPFQLLPAQPLTLSLPITLFHDTPFSTFESLQARVECAGVISQDWRKEWNSTSLSLFQLNSEEAELSVTFCVAVMKDLTYTVSFRGMLVDPQRGGILSNFPSCIHSVSTLKLILESVARSYICIGNADDRFVSLPTIRHGVLKDHSRANIVAMIDSKRTGRPSVYHVACEILVPSTRESRRCSCCSSYHNVLRAIVFRSSKDDRTHPSSHTNYTALNSPEKNKRLHRLHVEAKNARQKLERLREKIGLDAARASPNVDEALDGDLRLTISEEDKGCERKYPEGSFQRVFWDQQKKAASLNNSRSMKWHPLFVKWCLYLRHVSGKGYEMLRKTGCICLPSQRTLRDYTHYTSATIGFSAEVDKQLRDAVDMSEERNRCVTLVIDEVHIKDDLVYDKHNGMLVGFENLGDTNNHLIQFEAALSGDTAPRPLAKSMLVLMVRGLFTSLRFPYAQFACSNLTGDLLIDPVWEAISRIERQGIQVLALTCDGASTNRRLWKLHSNGERVTYKVNNIFAQPARPLYFISDPPHLLKTTRNCWWNSKRMLWWLQEDFLAYLRDWEESVSQRTEYTVKEKGKMLLSAETRYGIEVTVRSFIELTKMLFTIPGVTVFLSEKLSQDPLEKFFGCQRQRGGTSDDPTVAEFVKNTNALRVIDTVCGNVSRGNCRGNKESFDREKENTPLPKRRRYHK